MIPQMLQSLAREIEHDIAEGEQDLRKVGSLAIKIQSFVNQLSALDAHDHDVQQMLAQASAFQSRARVLAERRTREKQALEQEMQSSKLRTQRITEASAAEEAAEKHGFFAAQSTQVDSFIESSMDALESLQRQNVLVDRISTNLRQGALRLGVSSETLSRIESRFSGDKSLFIILLLCVVLLILLLRFVF